MILTRLPQSCRTPHIPLQCCDTFRGSRDKTVTKDNGPGNPDVSQTILVLSRDLESSQRERSKELLAAHDPRFAGLGVSVYYRPALSPSDLVKSTVSTSQTCTSSDLINSSSRLFDTQYWNWGNPTPLVWQLWEQDHLGGFLPRLFSLPCLLLKEARPSR